MHKIGLYVSVSLKRIEKAAPWGVEQKAHSKILERIWEKGPIGNVFTNLIAEKLPFQMLQTILKYS